MTPSHQDDARSAAREDVRADGTWPARPVGEEPTSVLVRWRLVAVQGELRLVGYNRTSGRGRLSSKIVGLDPVAREARTESGRVYTLEGQSGVDADGEWVLACWLRQEGVPPEDVRDVSSQLDAVLSKAAR